MTAGPSVEPELVARVHSLVTTYVLRKTATKAGINWEECKGKPTVDPRTGQARRDVPPAYRDARERVCREAFLRLRACRAREDFVAYFTGTICSVPQSLPGAEYQALTAALLIDPQWEDVKGLAMLALSGLSRV